MIEANFTELEMTMLKILIASPRTSTSVIAKTLDMRRDTVKEYLHRLKTKGLLIREGTPKSGQWLLTETANKELEEKGRRS